jgi:hypothetical protein
LAFCIPKLPRTGLANRLFPWARCKLFSLASGSPMLAPTWEQIKVGPILRGETDWRLYGGLFQPAPEEIAGIRKRWLTATLRSIPEPPQGIPGIGGRLPERAIVEFCQVADYFAPLNAHWRVVKRELNKIVRPRWRQAASLAPLAPIGLHVRRGDFTVPATPDELRTRGAVQTPIEWFVETLLSFRRALGFEAPAFVVSDGKPKELAQLLTLPSVRLIETGSAVGDLLLLSRAKVLIGSGGSTFSAWASYLGQMPTVTVPGQNLQWFKLHPETGAFVGEVADGQIPSLLLYQLDSLRGQLTDRERVSLP